jgi:uncharacterized membrane protein
MSLSEDRSGREVEQTYNDPVRTNERPGDGAARGTARMEAFADAVFAIAFTLPLLEITLPPGGEGFGHRLIALWPEYVGYVLASFVIGLYWVHHHFSGAIYRTTGHYFNVATVLFLAAIGFIAFPARAFAENIAEPASRATGAVFFAIGLFVTSLTWLVKWTVGRKSDHVDERLDDAYVARLDRRYRLSTIATGVGAALAWWEWRAGLAITLLVLLSYLRAPQTPMYRSTAPTIEGEG